MSFKTGTATQEYVYPTVVVVIKEGNAAAVGFQNVLLRLHSAINNRLSKAGGFGHGP